MNAERRRVDHAVEAAVATAASHGVVASSPRVLHHSNNVVVHLAPTPVVAKVATSQHRELGAASVARELAIGRFLAEQNAPTVAPATILPAGPHRVDGLALAFWDYCPTGADGGPDGCAAGRSLAALHAALDGYPDELPPFTAHVEDAGAILAGEPLPALSHDDRAFLADLHTDLCAKLAATPFSDRVLHGEVHLGNLLAADDGLRWIDFESACIGPLEWDLTGLPDEGLEAFPRADRSLLALLRDVRSCCVAAWCWRNPERAPELREAAEFHLARLRRRHRRRVGYTDEMKVVVTHDPQRFAQHAGGFLERLPVEHNVLATVLATLDRSESESAPLFAWVEAGEDGEVSAAALRTPPRRLLASTMSADSADALMPRLLELDPGLPGVNGPEPAATHLADAWRQYTGGTVEPGMSQGVYTLSHVEEPRDQPGGHARLAVRDDRGLLVEWHCAFHSEVGERGADIESHVDRRLADAELLVWDDERVVSMVGAFPPVSRVVRLGPVYTPSDLRRHGYVTALVAETSRRALATDAESCMLYTDLANPISNSIYQAVGYRRSSNAQQYLFTR